MLLKHKEIIENKIKTGALCMGTSSREAMRKGMTFARAGANAKIPKHDAGDSFQGSRYLFLIV